MMREPSEAPQGVILVGKPKGLTSHDVVARIRRLAGTRRVGHVGTLDPMAEGLLVVCIGPATRVVQFLTGLPKEYIGVIKLGAVSSTYDAEGLISAQSQPLPHDVETIRKAMAAQLGMRLQLAPPFSAIKVRGKKLYEYAREGGEVPERHRQVRIDRFDLEDYCAPEIRFFARVGSGTYIRSMAHDLGADLGCGAYLSALTRTSVGGFHLAEALPLEFLMENPGMLEEQLLTLPQALAHLPKITVNDSTEAAILHGRGFTTREILFCDGLPRPEETSLVLNTRGEALSVVSAEWLPDSGEGEDVSETEPGVDLERLLFFRPLRVLGPVA
jgi:tRNA pseudouridine55 synthase